MQYSFSKGSQDGSDVWMAVGVVDCVIVGRGVEVENGVLASTTGFVVVSGDGAVAGPGFGVDMLFEQPVTTMSTNNKNSRFIRSKYITITQLDAFCTHPRSMGLVWISKGEGT